MILRSFSYDYLPSVYTCWGVFRPFAYVLIGLYVFLLFRFKSSLNILDTFLYQTCFTNNFSLSAACLFILLTVSFLWQKFLISVQFSITIIFFHGVCFCCYIYEHITKHRLPRFSMFPSRSFIILHSTLRSMIHFKLNRFVKYIKSMSRIFLA